MSAKITKSAPAEDIGNRARALAASLTAQHTAKSVTSVKSILRGTRKSSKNFLGDAEEILVQATVGLLNLTGWKAAYRRAYFWEKRKLPNAKQVWVVTLNKSGK